MVSIEAVWDRTSGFIGEHLADVLRIAVPLVFVPMALMGVVLPMMGAGMSVATLALGLVAIACAIVMIWGNLALSALVLAPDGRAAAVRVGAARLPAAVLVSVLEMAAVLLAVAPIFIVFDLRGVSQPPMAAALPTMDFGPALFILLYALVFFLVGLVLVARLLLFDAALVAEARGVSALLRSFRLTRGLTLKLVGVLLLYVLVSQVAALATKTVFGAIFGLFTIGAAGFDPGAIATPVLVAVVQTGFSVLATVFAARLFVAVRDVREGVIELA